MTSARRAGLLRLLLLLLALTPLGSAIYKEWPAFSASFAVMTWGKFAEAQVLLISLMWLLALVPYFSLTSLGVPFSIQKVGGVYFSTQVMKYLPGGIWAFPGRMVVYRFMGVQRSASVVSVFRETTALYLGAVTVGLAGLLQGLPVSKSLSLAIGFGVLVSILVILLTQYSLFWKALSSIKWFSALGKEAFQQIGEGPKLINWLPRMFLGSGIFWLLMGLPFRQLIAAVSPGGSNLSLLEAASIFSLAWSAGFVAILIPAGFGIREAALAVLLAEIVPLGTALHLAVLARIAWVIAEGFWILVALLWLTRRTEFSWENLRRFVNKDKA